MTCHYHGGVPACFPAFAVLLFCCVRPAANQTPTCSPHDIIPCMVGNMLLFLSNTFSSSSLFYVLLCMLYTDSVCHPPALQIRAQSENDADDELLSVAVMKGDKKVVAGTQSGVVNLYSWGHLEDCSDRFPGAASLPLLLYCSSFLAANCNAYKCCLFVLFQELAC